MAALVLGGAASSAQGGIPTAQTSDVALPVAEVLPASPAMLLGFAPPPMPTEPQAPVATPQFRIAAGLPSGPLGIPGIVLQAYKLAANRVGAESPQCKLPWFLLAGIGRIESNHAGNGSVDQFGTTINPIAGPVLDGSLAGNAVIKDTDGGRIDGDPAHDRAMGPMQFIPSTWAAWGSDANGDGKSDPNNVFDATYSAGRYLCAGITDIMNDRTKVSAVLRYNRSMEYVSNVLGWAGAYATGVLPTDGIREPKKPATSSSSTSSKPRPEPGSSSSAPSSTESTTQSPDARNCFVICLPPLPPQLQPKPQPQPRVGVPPKATPGPSAPPARAVPSAQAPGMAR
ncbi:hypothetical protein GS4_41_00120 [Gordonia soli NBRC 108243]|uniref:Transglycosylase SLT domain-containing protein n=1 Tax=Gordonia soli NBRC 108243 TaxID=1223545 RepID=M0QR57_9ACTN|nr:hypothetical protein GS4_41_00120 [Gordonia soli NBRC 108243]